MNTTGLRDVSAPLAFGVAEGNSKVPHKQIILAKNGLWHSPRRNAGVTVEVFEGTVWITVEGDLHDYVLHEGESFHSVRNTQVVAQSLCGRSRMVVQE